MHDSSMALMREFIASVKRDNLTCLDVGSMDVNGSYRHLIPISWQYTGIDIAPGDNVDIVVPPDCPDWRIEPKDIVISGQCLEHVRFPWLMMEAIASAMKGGGICCIIAPSKGKIHRYPVDTFRYNPDGMQALADWAGLEVVSITHLDNPWGDCRLIARNL